MRYFRENPKLQWCIFVVPLPVNASLVSFKQVLKTELLFLRNSFPWLYLACYSYANLCFYIAGNIWLIITKQTFSLSPKRQFAPNIYIYVLRKWSSCSLACLDFFCSRVLFRIFLTKVCSFLLFTSVVCVMECSRARVQVFQGFSRRVLWLWLLGYLCSATFIYIARSLPLLWRNPVSQRGWDRSCPLLIQGVVLLHSQVNIPLYCNLEINVVIACRDQIVLVVWLSRES